MPAPSTATSRWSRAFAAGRPGWTCARISFLPPFLDEDYVTLTEVLDRLTGEPHPEGVVGRIQHVPWRQTRGDLLRQSQQGQLWAA